MSTDNNDDFWNSLVASAYAGEEERDFAGGYLTASEKEEAEEVLRVQAAVEHRMAGRSIQEGSFNSVRGLTDIEREKSWLPLPVEAGTKVQFASNMGAVLAYEDAPTPNMAGVVVAVKSASGPITAHDGKVFVRWEDGKVRSIHAQHLKKVGGRVRTTTAAVNRIRVASLGDLSEFLRVAGMDNTLVHKATKDLWHVKKDADGYLLERLFNDSGAPLKV
jgi:hypothetical protein